MKRRSNGRRTLSKSFFIFGHIVSIAIVETKLLSTRPLWENFDCRQYHRSTPKHPDWADPVLLRRPLMLQTLSVSVNSVATALLRR